MTRVTWQLGTSGSTIADQLLRREVADVLGSTTEDVRIGRHCPRCGSSDHGRPIALTRSGIRAPHVSLSRAVGVVLVAVSVRHPVGVDIEADDVAWSSESVGLVLHAYESAGTAADLTRTWVRKESLLKATGHGLQIEPSRVHVSDAVPEPQLMQWPKGSTQPTVTMRDVPIDGYVACVTVLGTDSRQFRLRQATPAMLSG